VSSRDSPRHIMFLVEKLQDVQTFLEDLICEIYGRRPEWIEFELRESYTFQTREFIRMSCLAGSVQARLGLRASTGAGISRDILQLSTKDGCEYAWLTHRGVESEHKPGEVQRTG